MTSAEAPEPTAVPEPPQPQVRRAKPADIANMVNFLNRVRKEGPKVDRAEIMQSFVDKGFMIAELEGNLVGVVAWHVENLVACIEELYINPAGLRPVVGPAVLRAIEEAANQLMAEAALIFIAPRTPKATLDLYGGQGYKATDPSTLVRAWREAAMNLLQPDMKVYVKVLREARITRPI